MRTPEGGSPRRAAKTYEKDLELRYLAPGAFTVLSPENQELIVDPPRPAINYRISPTKKRRRNAAFTIIAEPESSHASSRSSSPSGKVSPFKGRGFNPIGSRHASPLPSPPPERHQENKQRAASSERLASTSPKKSKIPTLQRRGSSAGSIFGDRVLPEPMPLSELKRQKGITSPLSKSLNNITSRKVPHKPPPSPGKQNFSFKSTAYTRLSPITGSSPETIPDLPKQNQTSSSSKIPRSRSTPPSRSSSPTSGKPPLKPTSKNSTRVSSRATSRDPSPAKFGSTNISVKNNYKNVKPKVNSFNTPKPKVPPKPQVPLVKPKRDERQKTENKVTKPKQVSNKTSEPYSDKTNTGVRRPITKRNSDTKIKTDRRRNDSERSENREEKQGNKSRQTGSNGKNGNNKSVELNKREENKKEEEKISETKKTEEATEKNENVVGTNNDEEGKEKTSTLLHSDLKVDDETTPPTSAAVSSATKTATKPILQSNILGESPQDSDGSDFLPDARNLSASSVSSALNRMSNTVLDSKTVLKDRNIKDRSLPPAVRAVVMMKRESQKSLEKQNTNEGKTEGGRPNSVTNGRPNSATNGRSNSGTSGIPKSVTTIARDEITLNSKSGNTSLPSVETVPKVTPNSNFTKNVNGINGESANNNVKNFNASNNHNHNASSNHDTSITNLFNNNNNSSVGKVVTIKGNELVGNDSEKEATERNRNVGNLNPSETAVLNVESDRPKSARTVVVTDVKPIHIMVKEKPSPDVESGNLIVSDSAANGLGERASLHPPSSHQSEAENNETAPLKENVCSRFVKFCKSRMTCAFCKRNTKLIQVAKQKSQTDEETQKPVSCWNCRRKRQVKEKQEKIKQDLNLVQESAVKEKWWSRLNCCSRRKAEDKVKPSWSQRRKAWMEKFKRKKTASTKRPFCNGKSCKDILKMMFCVTACTKCKRNKKVSELDTRRTASMTSKKKSLTPTLPVEDPKPKLDISLVEHTSLMKGAIPVLPVPLAWFCLILNVFLPGVGTVFSGLFSLCVGKPRFSQNYGAKQRIGAFLIDIVIGCGQLFTVLFCLVGWGWSIWWGVTMLKIARKYKKIKESETTEQENNRAATTSQNHLSRDVERGT